MSELELAAIAKGLSPSQRFALEELVPIFEAQNPAVNANLIAKGLAYSPWRWWWPFGAKVISLTRKGWAVRAYIVARTTGKES